MLASIGVCASLAVASADVCSEPDAQTRVCVSWSRFAPPTLGLDYRIEFDLGATEPSVVLITGDPQWNITATHPVTGEPAALDSIRFEPTLLTSSYGLSFNNGFDQAVGDIRSIGKAPSSWRGTSRILGGRVGRVLDALSLRASLNGKGGDISGTFIMLGLDGKADVRRVTDAVWIIDDLTGTLGVREVVKDSTLEIARTHASATVELNELKNAHLGFGSFDAPAFEGYLLLRTGLTGNSNMFMRSLNEGVIDLNGGDVEGLLETPGGGGHIINGGTVKGSGHVWVAAGDSYTFTGTATFKQMDEGSVVEAELSNMNGHVTILGDMNGQLWCRVAPLLPLGHFEVLGDIGSTGSILVAGSDLHGIRGDLHGRITVAGTVYGSIATEQSTLPGSLVQLGGLGDGGTLRFNTFAGDTSGDLFVGSPVPTPTDIVQFDGCLSVGGDYYGRIVVNGCHKTADPLNICVDGTLAGTIEIVQNGCPHQVIRQCVGCP